MAGYEAATSEGEREYWTRQVIISEVRAHQERNRVLLRRAQLQFAAILAATLVIGIAAVVAYVRLLG